LIDERAYDELDAHVCEAWTAPLFLVEHEACEPLTDSRGLNYRSPHAVDY
jgi:hypothetical protein